VLTLAVGFCALTVAVEPARLQIQPQAAPAKVVIRGLPQKTRLLHLWASVGTVTGAQTIDGDEGGSRIEAFYQPPEAGAPTFAVIAAWDERSGEAGVATVELEGRTEIPVESEAGAQVSVNVGGRKATARADAHGHARVPVWVRPGVRTARVTAVDAHGNTNAADVPLDLPPPTRVWLVPGYSGVLAVGAPVPLYAFAVAPAVPRVVAPGAVIAVDARPGISVAKVSGAGDVVVTATVGDGGGGQAELALHLAAPPPQPRDSGVSVEVATPTFADPRMEIGASVGARFSGALVAAAVTAEWRRRLGRSRFHLGVDVGGLYATGNAGSFDLLLGGVVARATAEARFSLGERVALCAGIGLGGAVVGEHRVDAAGTSSAAVDGGPSLAIGGSLLMRIGPGLLAISAGYAWTPLVGLGLAVLDGGMLSVGYRALKF
jgi:hypothetical protein